MSLPNKRPKACVDAPVGFRTINDLSANLASLNAQLLVEHSPPTDSQGAAFAAGGSSVGNYELPQGTAATLSGGVTPGAHDHPLIARGVAVVGQTTTDPSLLSAYGVVVLFLDGSLTQMKQLATGKYFFPMTGFTKVWGKAVAIASPLLGGGTPTFARCVPAISSAPGTTGLVVYTYRLQNPDGVHDILYPFHTGFSLVAFGRRDSSPADASGAAGRPTVPFARKPRRFIRFPNRRR